MKKLLILTLAIFCFYGCKSTSSEESAFPGVGGNWTNKSTLTKAVFTNLIRSQDLIGLIWDNICNKNETAFVSNNMIVRYDEKIDRSNSASHITHEVKLLNDSTKIQYEHIFYSYYDSLLKKQLASDYATFYKKESSIEYIPAPKEYSIFGLEDIVTSKKEETFEEFCKKYEAAYEEAKSSYKVVANSVSSKTFELGDLYKPESFPTVYSKLTNEESEDSIETWIATSGTLKGLALKIIEKDSNETKTKTVTYFYVE